MDVEGQSDLHRRGLGLRPGDCRAHRGRRWFGGHPRPRSNSAGAEVAAALGGSWHPCDVLDFDGIEVVIDEAVDALGGLDVASTPPVAERRDAPLGRDGPSRSTTSGR